MDGEARRSTSLRGVLWVLKPSARCSQAVRVAWPRVQCREGWRAFAHASYKLWKVSGLDTFCIMCVCVRACVCVYVCLSLAKLYGSP